MQFKCLNKKKGDHFVRENIWQKFYGTSFIMLLLYYEELSPDLILLHMFLLSKINQVCKIFEIFWKR